MMMEAEGSVNALADTPVTSNNSADPQSPCRIFPTAAEISVSQLLHADAPVLCDYLAEQVLSSQQIGVERQAIMGSRERSRLKGEKRLIKIRYEDQ
jgi:hypothetical protein